jgi:hypothetical protein
LPSRITIPPAHRPSCFCIRALTLLLIALMSSGATFAYSVLTHEAIVDLVWTDKIQPLLLKRFPGLSVDQLKEAHASRMEAPSFRT